jgi:sec-independent protein translocase protein TatA
MNMMFAVFGIGGWEVVLIMGVVLVLFGAKKLPELAKGLGQGIKEFKKATKEVTDEIQSATNVDDHYSSPPPKDRQIEPSVQKSLPESSQPEKAATVPQSTEHKA